MVSCDDILDFVTIIWFCKMINENYVFLLWRKYEKNRKGVKEE